MIHLLMLIPIAVTLYIVLVYYDKFPCAKTRACFSAWPLVVGLIVIYGSKALIERSQTADTEWWTGWAEVVTYDEPWTERVVTTTTDDKGNVSVTVTYDYHPAEYSVTDSNGIEVRVDRGEYRRLEAKFGNSHFQTLWHSGQSSWGDGNRHFSKWPGTDATFTPVTTTHRYENRVIASHSVFKFEDVKPDGLFKYPAISNYYECPSVLRRGGAHEAGDEALTKLNARLGRKKQVRVWLLVFDNEPFEKGRDQEAFWQGGNKNEIVIVIGLTDKTIGWCHCFSWTERDDCKLGIRDLVLAAKTLDVPSLVRGIEPVISEKFERKQFAEFSYLSVDPPLWAIVTVLVVLVTAGGGYIYYIGEITNEGRHRHAGYSARSGSSRWAALGKRK